MNKEAVVEYKGEFIEIRYPKNYELTRRNADAAWELVADACRQYSCNCVLIVTEQPRREMSMVDVFGSAVQAAEAAAVLKLALCFVGYETDDLSDFFKTVAFNRGATVEFFSNCGDALEWLGISTDLDQ